MGDDNWMVCTMCRQTVVQNDCGICLHCQRKYERHDQPDSWDNLHRDEDERLEQEMIDSGMAVRLTPKQMEISGRLEINQYGSQIDAMKDVVSEMLRVVDVVGTHD